MGKRENVGPRLILFADRMPILTLNHEHQLCLLVYEYSVCALISGSSNQRGSGFVFGICNERPKEPQHKQIIVAQLRELFFKASQFAFEVLGGQKTSGHDGLPGEGVLHAAVDSERAAGG